MNETLALRSLPRGRGLMPGSREEQTPHPDPLPFGRAEGECSLSSPRAKRVYANSPRLLQSLRREVVLGYRWENAAWAGLALGALIVLIMSL